MDHFSYLHGQLHAESIPLAEIAENVGTPAYVYSRATLSRHYQALVLILFLEASWSGSSALAATRSEWFFLV